VKRPPTIRTRYTGEDTSAWSRVLPVLALSGAGIGLLETDTAMWMAKWWQQVLTIAGLTGVGVLVVGIKMLAH
jgi:hypothetical protein